MSKLLDARRKLDAMYRRALKRAAETGPSVDDMVAGYEAARKAGEAEREARRLAGLSALAERDAGA